MAGTFDINGLVPICTSLAAITYINLPGICLAHFTGQADQPNDITILAWIAFSHEADTLHIT